MLEIRRLIKTYPSFTLKVDHFEIKKGKITALVGENGAGKTTLLRCITNLITNYQGDILVEGEKYTGKEKNIISKISFMSEESTFIQDLNSNEHFKIAHKLSKRWDTTICDALVHKLTLDTTKPVRELSRGNKIKLGIIIALARSPQFVIMDEPTTSLDPVMHETIIEEIIEWRKKNTTFLISSHSLDDVKSLADEVVIIKNGKIVDRIDRENDNVGFSIHKYILSSLKENR